MEALFDKPETTGLCFHSHQDALDCASDCVNDVKHWLAVNDLDIVKRYKDAEIEIAIKLRSRAYRDDVHLVFRSIPNMRVGHTEPSSNPYFSTRSNDSRAYGNNHFVLISHRYCVKCPEGLITSEVGLEPAKKRLDLWREIL